MLLLFLSHSEPEPLLPTFERLSFNGESSQHQFLERSIKDDLKVLQSSKQNEIKKIEVELSVLNEKRRRNMPLHEANDLLEQITADHNLMKELRNQLSTFLCFTKQLLDELKETEEYDRRRMDRIKKDFKLESKRFQASLPIYAKKEMILNTIEKWPVTILTAETGSGKSTQLVQYLHQRHPFAKIVCTQPRKVAAISLAARVSEEMHSKESRLVGYHVGTRSSERPETRILYVTDNILLNECLHDSDLKKYSFIVVDEAHERSISTDLLLAMVKNALSRRSQHDGMRLIISSATIDPKVFERYFSGVSKCIHVSGRTYPVEAFYEQVSIGMDYLKIAVAKAKELHKKEPLEGDILVFLTTPVETEQAQTYIQRDMNISSEIKCLVLHGRLGPEEQQLVFEKAPRLKRKIVFATNCAETSITIPNIKYVIDAGMVKEKHYDRKKNASLLSVGPVNKSSAEQRMGRAGRTQPGKCYRLYTKEEFNAMENEMLPEILRENLGLAMLKLYELNIGDPFNYDFVEAPPKESLVIAKQELKDLEAIEGDDSLTQYGQIMAVLELEPKMGKFVTLSIDMGFVYDAMVMAAACSIGGSIYFRGGTEDEKQMGDRLKTRFLDDGGDLFTHLQVYKEWSDIPERTKNSWCVANSMNAKSLRHTRDLIQDMKRNVEKLLDIRVSEEFEDLVFIKKHVPLNLLKCFRASIAYFSGHPRGGYYRPGIEPD